MARRKTAPRVHDVVAEWVRPGSRAGDLVVRRFAIREIVRAFTVRHLRRPVQGFVASTGAVITHLPGRQFVVHSATATHVVLSVAERAAEPKLA